MLPGTNVSDMIADLAGHNILFATFLRRFSTDPIFFAAQAAL